MVYSRDNLEAIYEKYKDSIFGIGFNSFKNSQDADDVVQETFLRIARNFEKVGEVYSAATRNFYVLITERAALTIWEKEKNHRTVAEEFFMDEDSGKEPAVPDSAFDACSHGQLVDAIKEGEMYGW